MNCLQRSASSIPAGYSALLAVDHIGDDIASIPRSQVWLAEVCNANPECGFFNTNGKLSFAVSRSSEFPLLATQARGRCLYKKNADRLQWTYQRHKDFRYSCMYFSILSVTRATGPLNTTGFLNLSAPSDNRCLDLNCCKALCDVLYTGIL